MYVRCSWKVRSPRWELRTVPFGTPSSASSQTGASPPVPASIMGEKWSITTSTTTTTIVLLAFMSAPHDTATLLLTTIHSRLVDRYESGYQSRWRLSAWLDFPNNPPAAYIGVMQSWSEKPIQSELVNNIHSIIG